MSLQLVATPIGNPEDISLRAMRVLREADVVIGEERKPVSMLLKSLGVNKPIELLNEHSKPRDIEALAELCLTSNVALVSDCGTPGFCDPGAELVALCRKRQVAVTAVPGASSLMALITQSGEKLGQFVFAGFLPAKQEARSKAIKELCREKRAVVIMDTPYRLDGLLEQLALTMPERMATVALRLTAPDEHVEQGKLAHLRERLGGQKAEFMILLHHQIQK